MKIDYLVMNINREYQTDHNKIENIINVGFPYKPKMVKEQMDLRHQIFGLAGSISNLFHF